MVHFVRLKSRLHFTSRVYYEVSGISSQEDYSGFPCPRPFRVSGKMRHCSNSLPSNLSNLFRFEPSRLGLQISCSGFLYNAINLQFLIWLGREDSNLRMTGSKPVALPLGDGPITLLT